MSTCGECRFATKMYGPDNEFNVECRRFPKVPIFRFFMSTGSVISRIGSEFPTMIKNEWCGEFKASTTDG